MEHVDITPTQRRALCAHLADAPWPSVDADRPAALLTRCPVAKQTQLLSAPRLAAQTGIASVHIKDERDRMGLGSFKALGAAYVIAHDAAAGVAEGQTYITASAGNHGMSVAAGARAFGAKAIIFIAQTVPENFAIRLRDQGADVRREGQTYEDSMAAAAAAAATGKGVLLSDSSWPGYFGHPHRLMEGYLVLMQEVVAQIPEPPTHIFLQAGVGGLAAACAAFARQSWGSAPWISVVEPEVAPALFASVIAGTPQMTRGPASQMGRLDCKEPSLIALKGLARDANCFMTITEAEGHQGNGAASRADLPTTPSGAAGLAGLLSAAQAPDAFRLNDQSRALVVLSERHG